jgi:hypothetical protein
MNQVIDLKKAKKDRERERYNDLVMKTFRDFEHADKREVLDRKAEVQLNARERL